MDSSPTAAPARRPPLGDDRLGLGLGLVPLALHLAALTRYDFFRDELYFIACGRHPSVGYVDQPALVPLVAAITQLGGERLWLLRLIPALLHAATVVVTCRLVRLLGGGRAAQLLAGVAVGVAPLLLALHATWGTTALEPLAFTVLVTAVATAVIGEQPRAWIVAGLAAGVALATKYTVGFLLVALLGALLAVGPRRALTSRWLWIGAALALVLGAPSLIWQAAHGWPFRELLHAGAAGKNRVLPPGAWLEQQALIYQPLAAPLWITGGVALVVWRRTRFIGLALAALFFGFMALHAKDYYLVGIFPTLFAAGAVAVARWPRVAVGYALVVAACGLVLAPVALPLFAEPRYIAYREAVLGHDQEPVEGENLKAGLLPQYFADMHGWRELAATVGSVARSLSPEERARAVVFAQNYGEAAAVELFGDGTLPVASGHNQYFLWGLHGEPEVAIIIGGRHHERTFGDVRLAATVTTPYAMPYENDLPIYVARQPKVSLSSIWPSVRHYE
jgi:dolichyl-phosphate-mannose-protein mannosyltransferase